MLNNKTAANKTTGIMARRNENAMPEVHIIVPSFSVITANIANEKGRAGQKFISVAEFHRPL